MEHATASATLPLLTLSLDGLSVSTGVPPDEYDEVCLHNPKRQRLEEPSALAPDDGCSESHDHAIVWDAGAARMKLSIAGAIKTLANETPYLVDALEEWCTHRLYLLECLAPRRNALTDDDLKVLGDDLYEITNQSKKKNSTASTVKAKATLIQTARWHWMQKRTLRNSDKCVLDQQLSALDVIKHHGDGPRNSVKENTSAPPVERNIISLWKKRERWWCEFASPPARIHTQGHLLSDANAEGGVRNTRQHLFLDWLRDLHTSKEADLRKENGEYTNKWRTGDWGSPYSTSWPSGAKATRASVTLEHVLPVSWLRNGEVVLETGYSQQDVTTTTLINQDENNRRSDRALSVFGDALDANNSQLYTPPGVSELKRTRLALATCHGFLSIPLVQQETKALGSKRFAGNFGVAEYARRLDNLCLYAKANSSPLARRIALITSCYHGWCNPLVFRAKNILEDCRFYNLLKMRLHGGRDPQYPQCLRCGLALLVDDTLAREVGDAPV